MKFINKISIYPILLTLVSMILGVVNYHSGTHLIGWDNITPEFNIPLNLERSIFGVWQGYRGLGYPDGMAQTANLFHTIYIYLLSLVLPDNMLRYVYLFGTHVVGGLACYYLGIRLFKNKMAAFVSALFYMLNLGITQMYFAPLEAFATHFAALPLITLTLLWTLSKPAVKSFGVLLLASLLMSPQGLVPTVFFVSMILWTLIIFFHTLKTRQYKVSLIAFFVILAANAFWLLPYLYNGFQNAAVIQNSRINQFSSEEVFFRNRARGDILSVLTMKGFMMDAIEYDTVSNSYMLFMNLWRNVASHILYYVGAGVIAAITFWGIVKTVAKKNMVMVPFLVAFLISLIFLANRTPVLSLVTDFMRIAIPPLGEMFRFPFTKFITLFALCYALILGYGITQIGKKTIHKMIISGMLVIAILGMSYPAFTGNFISNQLKLSIPQDYFNMFDFFENKDKNARIAYLPTHTFWNWQYRDWGYRGSDFIWHGIQQPILLRPFDPWSVENEQFYNELSRAVLQKDTDGFNKILEKYQISYLLIDQSVMNTLSNKQINYQELNQFLDDCNCIQKTDKLGKLTIHTLKKSYSGVSLIPEKSALTVGSSFVFSHEDVINKTQPNYIKASNAQAYYLFPSLATDKLQETQEFTVKQNQNSIVLQPKSQIDLQNFSGKILELPSLTDSEFVIPVTISTTDDGTMLTLQYPKVYLNNRLVNIPAESIPLPSTFTPTSVLFNDFEKEIVLKNGSVSGFLINNFDNTLTLSDGASRQVVSVDTTQFSTGSYYIPLDEQVTDIRIEVPKISDILGVENALKTDGIILSEKGSELNLFKTSSRVSVDRSSTGIDFSVKDGTGKVDYYNNTLFHSASYVMIADTEYESGLPMRFYVDNPQEDRSELETIFSKTQKQNTVIIPPTGESFSGYGFHFTVKSVGHETAKSTLSKVSLYSIPLQTIQQMRLLNTTQPIEESKKPTENIGIQSQYGTYFYEINMPQKTGTVVLSQAYNPGWKAYMIQSKSQNSKFKSALQNTFPFFFGSELNDHVKVNNWANGWTIQQSIINNQSSLILVYLPQYLEYLGFGILGMTILLLVIFKVLEKQR